MRSSPELVSTEIASQSGKTFVLDDRMRRIVETAIIEVCHHRRYELTGINVRTNHAHTVVSYDCPPEKIVEAFKSYSTRALRRAGLVDRETKVWARHASTRYLWKASSVEAARNYCLYFQGDEFPSFDEVLES